jgi:catechol 2,3-dioxygenase-like lactoylglutathione lyase family enzyme
MRLQLAINVRDLDAAIDFYTRAFGVELNKRRPGYANLVLENPAVKLVLFEQPDAVNQLNHVGFEVFDDADVKVAADRLAAAGLETELQEEKTCCFARQNKVVTHDPNGIMWEWYRVLEDSPTFFAEPAATAPACCA